MKDGKHVILCIDDDDGMLAALRVILEASGYVMVPARTAEEGLRAYKQHRPDLLIVDLMMEEIDAGTSFVKELGAIGNTAPVFMLSSVGDSFSMSTDYSELGLAGVLQKPLDTDVLLTLLKTRLR